MKHIATFILIASASFFAHADVQQEVIEVAPEI